MKSQVADLKSLLHKQHHSTRVSENESRKVSVEKKKRSSSFARAPRPYLLAIASGKGGVGKTCLAVNLAIDLKQKGKRVLIFDADLGLANINVLLGEIPQYNLYHVFNRQKTLADVIHHSRFGIDIVSGATGLAELADLNAESRHYFLTQLQQISNYDLILIDVGAGISRNVLSFLEIAEQLILITTPEATAITDAYGLLKVFYAKKKSIQTKIIINKALNDQQGMAIFSRLKKVSAEYLQIKLQLLGVILEDSPTVLSALHKRIPYKIMNAKSKPAVAIEQIGTQLIGELTAYQMNVDEDCELLAARKENFLQQRFKRVFNYFADLSLKEKNKT